MSDNWHSSHKPIGKPGQCRVCMILEHEPGVKTPCALAGRTGRPTHYCSIHKDTYVIDNRCVNCDKEQSAVDHPAHYGGDTTYEAIKVIEAWGLGFCLGNAVKYICRAGKKLQRRSSEEANRLEDLKKARWYLDREIARREKP